MSRPLDQDPDPDMSDPVLIMHLSRYYKLLIITLIILGKSWHTQAWQAVQKLTIYRGDFHFQLLRDILFKKSGLNKFSFLCIKQLIGSNI